MSPRTNWYYLKASPVTRARSLRKNATDCERILWRHLRNRSFGQYKFRRQHPLDRYVLDFYCPAVKLAVELDGSGHSYRLGVKHDQAREEFLAGKGITVVRFWNHQVRQSLIASFRQFGSPWKNARQQIPHLSPLPLQKGEVKTRARAFTHAHRAHSDSIAAVIGGSALALRCCMVMIRATEPMMSAAASKVHKVTVSFANNAPSNTATIGFTYA